MQEAIHSMFFLFGYVSNSYSFPHPLTMEDESKLFELYKSGDENARNTLIERNLRLVAHIAKKYISIENDIDDLISIGTIGLIKAVSSFNPERCTRLSTYAARCIDNEILMFIRSLKKTQNEVSLNDTIGVDREGNEITLIDVIGSDTEAVVEEVELKIQVRDLYNKMKTELKKHEKSILELRYGLLNETSKTQNEIASMMGISRSYVSRIESKAIKKLAKALNSCSSN